MQTVATIPQELPLKTRERVVLYPARGRVHALRDFVDARIGMLHDVEQALIAERFDDLAASAPRELSMPLVRTQRLHTGAPATSAIRRGTRSAFIPSLELKLKGCRPEPAAFPAWELDEQYRIRVVQIPFGVLRAESVMREVLGYCCVRRLGLTVTSVPVAVMEYADVPTDARFALVSRLVHDHRIESRLDCGGLTLHALLRLHASPRASELLGREAGLTGMDRRRYAEAKTDWLIALNAAGGFRGILNSNLGNDVVEGADLAGLCDFDTFAVHAVPDRSDTDGIRRFVHLAVLELIKTSLPFVDFMDVSHLAREDACATLACYYRAHSSICRAYEPKLLRTAASLGWDGDLVQSEMDAAYRTQAAGELLKELIPNSMAFQEFRSDSWYVAHG